MSFTRSGVHGELKVTKDRFVLDARLGFCWARSRTASKREIVKNLDQLLAHESPVHAFDKAVARKTGAEEGRAARRRPERQECTASAPGPLAGSRSSNSGS